MSLTIHHRPRGDEHPYAVSSDQREPVLPIAGEPVVVHAVTPADASVERVWVTVTPPDGAQPYEVASEPAGRARSEKTGPGGGVVTTDEESWRAEIGAFVSGQVSYSVSVSADGRTVSAGPFGFVPRRTVVLDTVRAIRRHETGVVIEYAPEDESGTVYGQWIAAESDGTLVLRVAELSRLQPDAGVTSQHGTRGQDPGAGIEIGPFRLTVSPTDGTLRVAAAHGRELITEAAPMHVAETSDSPVLTVTRFLSSTPDEAFYGLGERFHAFNQRGRRVDTRVYEQYCNQGVRSYIPVPLLVSSRGYALWAETLRRCVYDLAAHDPSTVAITSSDPVVSARLISGSPREIVRTFTQLTGRCQAPPEWVFGPWMSGNEWSSEARVMEEIERTLSEEIPASVVVIEAWSDEQTFYIWNDAQATSSAASDPVRYADLDCDPAGKWPNPAEMINRIHERGLKVVLWQIPMVKRLMDHHRLHQLDEAYVAEHGLCVAEPDGSPHHSRPGWFRGGMIPDFTNEETRRWWFSKRRYLLEECGVDGFKTDGGEQLWGEQTRFSNGRRGDEMINAYPLEYLAAYHQAMKDAGKAPVTFSRAGYTGVQQYAIHWAGDQESTWEELQAVYRAVLNAALSGIAVLGWDLAGFAGPIPSPELYKRSTACTTFSPLMQYHADFNHHRVPKNDRTPWNIAERTGDPTVLATYRRYATLRMRLIPYLHAEAIHAAATGDPMMTPLFYHSPEDQQAWQVHDQHYLGRSLLVAPVLEPETTSRRVYLPAGSWTDVWSGEAVVGPAAREVPVALSEIPVYLNTDAPWPLSGLEPFEGLPSAE